MIQQSGFHGMVELNGAQVFCDISGGGSPIVLVHAGITDSRMWDAQVEACAAKHLVVRYDLRGFGQSSIPPEPYAHHNDLHALFRHFDLGRAVVIGASYGGNVATDFTLEHPELVDALVLVNSLVGMETPSPGLRAGWDAVNQAMGNDDVDQAIRLETSMWVDGPHRSPEEVDQDVRQRVEDMNAALFARVDEQDAAEEMELDPKAAERFGEIQAPTLVIVGELDQPDATVSADAIVAGVSGAQKVTIADAAHLPSLESPERFNRLVLDFLDDVRSVQ